MSNVEQYYSRAVRVSLSNITLALPRYMYVPCLTLRLIVPSVSASYPGPALGYEHGPGVSVSS